MKSNYSAIRWALAACLFLIVLGSRWALVDRFGSDLPMWDQWDAEGTQLLAPWLEHRLAPGDFLRPHNEHRIVITRLVNFGLTVANGQWDQRLECAVNAVLPGIIAMTFFIMGCRNQDRRWHAPLFLLLAAAYALPMAWENELAGFHSAQFFLIALSFGTIAWLPRAAPWSRSWWLGAACGALALGSLASGFFAAAVVIGLLTVRLLRGETSLRAAGPALVFCGALVAIGWLTRVSVPYHESLKAQGMRDFAMTIVYSLQWPASGKGWLAGLLWLPWCWLAWRMLAGKSAADRAWGYTLVGLGGWVLLQILATAYERGAGGPPPASRYVDTLIFGAAVNGLAVGWLWRCGATTRWGRRFSAVLGLAWAASFGTGAVEATVRVLRDELPHVKTYYSYCEQNTRNYLATSDETYLQHDEIPYPGAISFLARLRSPALRSLLPASVRAPLPVAGAGRDSAFVRHDSRSAPGKPGRSDGFSPATHPLTNRVTWGSFGDRGAGMTGEWESAPLRLARGGWLKFEVAGQLGEPGVALELRDAATRNLLVRARPGKVPNDSWRSVYVPAPAGAFIVVARDEDPGRWLAFSQPVEMGGLSYWAWRGVKNGPLIAEAAAGAALLLGMIAWRMERARASQ